MKFREKFRGILRLLFPATPLEVWVFVLSAGVYGVLASVIALKYRIIFDDRIPWDAYFSFDNRAIVMTGGGAERHPLANYFFDALRNFALLLSAGKLDSVFRFVLAVCSALTVSLTLVQICKYLQNIIRLPRLPTILLLLFFGMFSTVILLSFTPETYTYTLFMLVAYNYYAAKRLNSAQEISTGAITLAGIGIGGLTVTNFIKVFIPLLFVGTFQNLHTFWKSSRKVLLSTVIFALLALWRMDFQWRYFFTKSGEQFEKFSNPKVTPYWDMVYSWFFSGNMLFSSFITRDYHNKKGFHYEALFMEVHTSVVPYIFTACIWACVLWGYLKNFRNSLVQILMISFGVDFTIHVILKFGLHTSYIYGGHFIFVVPLLLGWLFHAFRNSPKVYSGLFVGVSLLLFYLGLNNIYRMGEFFGFLNRFYQ